MTTIELRGVGLDAPDGTPLLEDVDLVVESGATLAVCGPAGAGKSALLRVLVGLADHTEGDVLLDDVVVNAVGPRDRDLALVLQDHPLHPHLDVHDNLAFASRLRRGFDKTELAERIDEVAGFLALESLLDLKPSDLDEAQRQRVAIGRALTRDALGYLFDEPFAAQPDRVRTHVRSVTTQWQRESGRTSLFTTSRVDEALTLADRVAVMHRGRIHQVGSPTDLYENPADLFVAGYLGLPPMNLLPAEVVGRRLITPVASIEVDDALAANLGDRDFVVVGLRPEHCLDATTAAGQDVADGVQVTARIDDVEWRGGTQLVYVGYDLAPEVEERLEAIEELLDFDLFQTFFVAELAAQPRLAPGGATRLVVPRSLVHVFDAETGVNLSQPGT